jgi:hypothetical protein
MSLLNVSNMLFLILITVLHIYVTFSGQLLLLKSGFRVKVVDQMTTLRILKIKNKVLLYVNSDGS